MRKTILYALFLILSLHPIDSYSQRRRGRATRPTSNIDGEARGKAQEWLSYRYKKCGDKYYVKMQDARTLSLTWFQSTNPPSIYVTGASVPPRSLSEADRLNGVDPQPVEWQGNIAFKISPYRIYPSISGWSAWMDSYGENYNFWRKKGEWRFQLTTYINPLRFECSQVPQ